MRTNRAAGPRRAPRGTGFSTAVPIPPILTPGSLTHAPLTPLVTPARSVFVHRGFELRLHAADDAFAFEIGHHDLTLHASTCDFRSPHAAERAGRRFVDDALGAFDAASSSFSA